MRLYIKQKVFSFGDVFHIRDETGNAKYIVRGEVFSFGKKLHVYNEQNNEVLYIAQKLLSWMPKYELYVQGLHVATVQKRVTFFKHSFDIYGTNLTVDGDFFAHSFRLLGGGGQAVMLLNKKFMSWGDSYEMEIFDPNLELLCIGVNLCIDAALHDDNHN